MTWQLIHTNFAECGMIKWSVTLVFLFVWIKKGKCLTLVKRSIGSRLKRIADLCMWSVCNQLVLPFPCRISHVMATTERACESAWESSAYDVESVRTWHAWTASALPLPKTEKAPRQWPMTANFQITWQQLMSEKQYEYGCKGNTVWCPRGSHPCPHGWSLRPSESRFPLSMEV